MPERKAREIAERCLILRGVIAVTHGRDRGEVWSWIERERLQNAVSSEEREFLTGPELSEHDMVQLSWRAEALAALLWAIGLLPELPPPVDPTDFRPALAQFPRIGDQTPIFLASARLRKEAEIAQQSERVYETHWAIRDAEMNGNEVPDQLNPDIVIERHHALNWLTGLGGADWDD